MKLHPENAQEALRRWDAGERLFSVSMGGLGPGYEQCIQVCIFEIVLEFLKAPMDLPKPQDGGYPKPTAEQKRAFDSFYAMADGVLYRIDREWKLGLSGAQAGAAKNAAYNFLAQPWEKAIESIPHARQIQVSKKFPQIPEF